MITPSHTYHMTDSAWLILVLCFILVFAAKRKRDDGHLIENIAIATAKVQKKTLALHYQFIWSVSFQKMNYETVHGYFTFCTFTRQQPQKMSSYRRLKWKLLPLFAKNRFAILRAGNTKKNYKLSWYNH